MKYIHKNKAKLQLNVTHLTSFARCRHYYSREFIRLCVPLLGVDCRKSFLSWKKNTFVSLHLPHSKTKRIQIRPWPFPVMFAQ